MSHKINADIFKTDHYSHVLASCGLKQLTMVVYPYQKTVKFKIMSGYNIHSYHDDLQSAVNTYNKLDD